MPSRSVQGAVRTVAQGRAVLRAVLLKDIIESSTGKEVVPFNARRHAPVLEELVLLANVVMDWHRGRPITRREFEAYRGKRVNAFRNNEIGDYCEFLLKDAFEKNKQRLARIEKLFLLGKKGYPDLKAIGANLAIFLEVKATSRPDTGSPRDFFYSLGGPSEKKIGSDGLHLLIGFVTKQVASGFIIVGFKIIDASRMRVSLKPEFNADNTEIYSAKNVIYQT